MRRQIEDKRILPQIQDIKSEHPFWGYRRVWAYMKYRLNQTVNKKRIYRIMKENNLLVTPNLRLRARRDNQSNRNKPRAARPNQFWGTDMTKALIGPFGWLYLVVVLDWYTKKIVGYSISSHSRTEDWLDALNDACNRQFPTGVLRKQEELYLVSDNGSQPTSKKYMQACSVLEIKQVFASYNNPKGNADTERVMRTIKEDLIWIREFSSPIEFTEAFKRWVEDYNNDYPHSTLDYLTPCQFEKEQLLQTALQRRTFSRSKLKMSDLLKKGSKGENNFPPSTPDTYPANRMTQPAVSAVAAYLPSKIKALHTTFSTGCRTTKNYT